MFIESLLVFQQEKILFWDSTVVSVDKEFLILIIDLLIDSFFILKMLPGLPLLMCPEPKEVQGGGFEDLSGLPK